MLTKGQILCIGPCPTVSCDILRLYPKQAKPKDEINLLVMMPGNPGLITLYQSLLEQIQAKHKDLYILGIGNLVGSASSFKNIDHFTSNFCETQTAQKLSVLYQEMKTLGAKNYKISFMGHSYGAYGVLNLAKYLTSKQTFLYKNLNIEVKYPGGFDVELNGFIAIAPTIVNIAKSKSGRRVEIINQYSIIYWILLSFGYFVLLWKYFFNPVTVFKYYFKFRGRVIDQKCLQATADLLDIRVVKYGFAMGVEEMDKITEPNESALTKFKAVIALLSYKDPWIGPESEQELRSVINRHHNSKIVNLPKSVRHAFVLKEESNRIIANEINTFISSIY